MFLFLAREFIAALEALGRPLQLSPSLIAFLIPFGLVFTVAWGILAVWLYAAIRSRYGPGPKSAVLAAVAVWLLSLVAPLSHLAAFGVVSSRFVAIDLAAELVLILAATLVGARQYKEWMPSVRRQECAMTTAKVNVAVIFGEAVRRAESAVLYEGLPHQMFESHLLKEERRRKAVRELHGYPFYQEPLAFAGEDAKRLSEVFAEPATYQPFSGDKLCGGFHPDFALEWHGGGDHCRALICFGCHEVMLFGPGLESRNDLDEAACERLRELLRGYRKNRPASSRV